MKHKKQHFIPCSYLEAWCDPNTPPGQEPFIWIMPKSGRSGYRRAPQNAFHETDMYTIQFPDGSRNLTIENNLAELENQFSEVRRNKLSRHDELTIDDRAILCAFASAIQARTPKQRDHIGKNFSSIKMRMEKMRGKIETAQPQDREKLKKAMSSIPSGGPTFNYEDIVKLAAAPLQHTLIPGIQAETPLFLQMNLAILFTENIPGFITSDAPCVWFDPEAFSRPFPYNAPGLVWPTIEITLPISPSQILLLNRVGINGYIPITESCLDELNRRIRGYSNKYFIVASNYTKPIWYEKGSPPKV